MEIKSVLRWGFQSARKGRTDSQERRGVEELEEGGGGEAGNHELDIEHERQLDA